MTTLVQKDSIFEKMLIPGAMAKLAENLLPVQMFPRIYKSLFWNWGCWRWSILCEVVLLESVKPGSERMGLSGVDVLLETNFWHMEKIELPS